MEIYRYWVSVWTQEIYEIRKYTFRRTSLKGILEFKASYLEKQLLEQFAPRTVEREIFFPSFFCLIWSDAKMPPQRYPQTYQHLFRSNTPNTAVFAGSMQLLAGVKLCTGRTLTNHPHYEDKHLRERTKQVRVFQLLKLVFIHITGSIQENSSTSNGILQVTCAFLITLTYCEVQFLGFISFTKLSALSIWLCLNKWTRCSGSFWVNCVGCC